MIRSLYTAASGMLAQQLNLDNIANNLANASTAGFRRRRLQFQDLLYQNMIMPGSAATSQTTVAAGLQIGLGTRPSASEIVQTQGDFAATGNPLDLTVEGLGFFQVHLPNGDTAYTRSGAFHLDAQGNVVTAEGDPIEPPITIPSGGEFDQHWRGWHSQCHAAGPASCAASGQHSAGALSQPRRPEQCR